MALAVRAVVRPFKHIFECREWELTQTVPRVLAGALRFEATAAVRWMAVAIFHDVPCRDNPSSLILVPFDVSRQQMR